MYVCMYVYIGQLYAGDSICMNNNNNMMMINVQ